jgi:rare lipoprotein A
MKLNNIIKGTLILLFLFNSTLFALDRNILAYKDRGIKYYPKYVHKGKTNIGKASWYGNPFHGRLTASGERYNMYGMTAAHKTYALGTRLKVTNLRNKKSVIVRVNDRGPFYSSRKIDLSYGAAKKIGMIHKGVSKVKIEVLSSKKGKRKSKYVKSKKKINKKKIAKKKTYKKSTRNVRKTHLAKKIQKKNVKVVKKTQKIQLASFSSKKNAYTFKKKHHLKNVKIVKHYVKAQKKMTYRVVVQCTKYEAKKLLKSKKFSGAYLLS